MQYLLGLIGILLGGFLFERGKRKSAEALNENVATKEEVQKIQGHVLENKAVIKSEEDKRKEISENANEEKSKSVGDADILDFFRKLK